MRTTNVMVAVLGVSCMVCAVCGARKVREVHEVGADESLPSPWDHAEPLAYEPNPNSLRNFDILSPDGLIRLQQYQIPELYVERGKERLLPLPPTDAPLSISEAQRSRIIQGLLTFGTQAPDPRLLKAIPILIVRQLRVDPFQTGPPPLSPQQVERIRKNNEAGIIAGLLTFDATTAAPPTSTPRPWWRRPPPVQLPVRPRLSDSTAETLAVGTSPLVTRFHGPVAMGSGGVGYSRLPDGSLAIGSGSIGFAQFDVLSVR